ncbi:MAG: hypothetical protein PHV97_07995 [Candidatus Omnitrophica bacterium]|nr:hypothetical protein [Candidatus Omnitrophota bacterium]
MLGDNRELIDQFNKEEQKRRRLEKKKLQRRVLFPKLSERFHKTLDRWDEFLEKLTPADCISRK